MITLRQLAESLTAHLNDMYDDAAVRTLQGVQYAFNIVPDAGEYKKAERGTGEDINTVTKYINGILTLLGDQKEGVTEGTISAILNTELELVIPDYNEVVEDADSESTYRLGDKVREIIDTVLSATSEGYIFDSDGNQYYVGTRYSFANTGLADIRAAAGESLTLRVYIDYTVVQAGFSSSKIELYLLLNESGSQVERIYPTRIDISRQTSMSSNVRSDRLDASAESTSEGTALTISLTKILRNSDFDLAAVNYIIRPKALNGVPIKVAPLGIRLVLPIGRPRVYTMMIADASISGESNYAIPLSVTLVEYMPTVDDMEE